jgi:hypothetical protein
MPHAQYSIDGYVLVDAWPVDPIPRGRNFKYLKIVIGRLFQQAGQRSEVDGKGLAVYDSGEHPMGNGYLFDVVMLTHNCRFA